MIFINKIFCILCERKVDFFKLYFLVLVWREYIIICNILWFWGENWINVGVSLVFNFFVIWFSENWLD